MAFNWFMSLISTIFSYGNQEAEKQGHDSSKEVKGSSDLIQENCAHKTKKQDHDASKEDKGPSDLDIFAHKAEKQGHDLIKEDKGSSDLSQEKTIDNLKDWELTDSIYSSDSSYVSKDCERPDSSDDSRRSGVLYRKKTLSSDFVKIVQKKKHSKSSDSSGYEGQSEDSRKCRSRKRFSKKLNYRKISPSSDFVKYVSLKEDTSFDKPSKTHAKSVIDNLKSSNYPEKNKFRHAKDHDQYNEEIPYNQGHRYNQSQQCDQKSNKDFDDYQKTPNFRPVVIDGCNIGHEYGRKKGNPKNFSAKGLWIAYSFFKDLGYMDNQISIIQWHIPEYLLTREDIHIMDNLRDLKVLEDVGSRIVKDAGLKDLIRPDDDLFIIKLAWEHNGISKKN